MVAEWICPACGASNISRARFCGECGASAAVAEPAPVAAPVREERRQITVLFSDASGYTSMAEHLDPEVVRDVMRRVYSSAESLAARYGGRVDKLMGDAVLVVFGDPVAHEDDAERAVRTALDLHAAVDAMRPDLESRIGSSFRMHSGINSGIVVTGDLNGDRASGPLGDMVNVAARLQSMADGGQVLIGPETYALVKDRFVVADLGERELKGRNQPVHVRRVEGLAAGRGMPSRRVGAFIGRHEELGVLLGAVDRVRDGESSLITVCAEAGAGKTRLLEEVRRRLDDDVVWLEGRAYPYTTDIPYSPLIDLISSAAGIDEGDKAEQVRSKLGAMVDRTLPGDDTAMVALAHLYELTPSESTVDLESFRSVLLVALAALVSAVAARAPTVVCLQDLHWVDPSTADLVRELTTVVDKPFVMICNFRPGFTLGARRERVLQLTEMSGRQTREQLVSLLEGAELPPGLLDAVIARAGGNPFFVEEIINSLIETDVLVREDTWVLRRQIDELALPSTIRGLIAARIDNLAPLQRRVLREVSVVGREFLYRLVRSVSNEPDDLDGSLEMLSAADLIREKSVDPELEYVFKHALTQEVAYEGLLRRDRQELHERVARAIESTLGDRVDEFVETLAYHFQRSGRVVEAVGYLRRAGRKALERYAMVESHNHYRAAYKMLTTNDTDNPVDPSIRDRLLLETLVEWATAHYYTGAYSGLHELITAHRDLPRAVGDDALRARWLAWQANVVWNHDNDISGAVALLEEALELARACGDATAEAFSLAWLTWVLTTTGEPARAIGLWPALEAILPRVADLTDRRYAYVKGYAGVAIASALRGDTLTARAHAKELIELGARTGNRRASAMGHLVLVHVYQVLGDRTVAEKEARAMVGCEADPIYTWLGEIFAVAATLGIAHPDETTRRIDTNRVEPARHGFGALIASYDLMASNLNLLDGQVAQGLRALEEAREQCASVGNLGMCMNIDMFTARLDARLSMGGLSKAVLRKPGFLRLRPGSGKRGRQAFEALSADLAAHDLAGMRAEVEYELGLLAKDQKRTTDARSHLQNVETILRDETYAWLRHEAGKALAEL